MEYYSNFKTYCTERLGTALRCGCSKIIPGNGFSGHYDLLETEFTICYLIMGKGTYVYEDGRRFPLRAGTVFMRLPGHRHSDIYEAGFPILEFYFMFPYEVFKLWERYGFISVEKPVFDIGLGGASSIMAKHRYFYEKLSAVPDCGTAPVMAEMSSYVAEVLSIQQPEIPLLDEIMLKAPAVLESDFESKCDLKKLAASLSMSYANFRKLFTKYHGISPGEYRIRKRIENAGRMILDGKLALKEIARLNAYPDLPSFSKQFKKITGVAPGSYVGEKLLR